MNSKYFKDSELQCHGKTCGPCKKLPTQQLVDKLNQIREAYGKAMGLTNAFRCPIHNATIPGAAKKSKHMDGHAADVADGSGEFAKWIVSRLDHFDIWIEDPSQTIGWIHIQCVPYGSWKKGMTRVFKAR